MAYYIGYYGTTLLILIGYFLIICLLLKRFLPNIKVHLLKTNSFWQTFWQRKTTSNSCPCLQGNSFQQTTRIVYIIKVIRFDSPKPRTKDIRKDIRVHAIPEQPTTAFLPQGKTSQTTINAGAVVAPGKPYPDEAGVEVVYDRGSYRMKN